MCVCGCVCAHVCACTRICDCTVLDRERVSYHCQVFVALFLRLVSDATRAACLFLHTVVHHKTKETT